MAYFAGFADVGGSHGVGADDFALTDLAAATTK